MPVSLCHLISIHAPTRGATGKVAIGKNAVTNFNPRSHERSDNYIPDEFKSYFISIHAPTRGATPKSLPPLPMFDNFNPRSHERSDHDLCSTMIDCIFQSTLPREERLPESMAKRMYGEISIHAPTRGATNMFQVVEKFMKFQSTLPREERQATGYSLTRFTIFQSTLPREERQQV